MRVLVVNAGSSSLKLSLLGDGDELVATDELHRQGDLAGDHALGDALERFLDASPTADAVGHRIVHGGEEFVEPLVIDAESDRELGRLADLAPLHNPPALAAIHELRRRRPGLVQVACFDTSFHATLPWKASTYALPRRWREELGIRRFGFHGLSHAWASMRAAELLGRPLPSTRLVTAHVGAGASLAAVDAGRSVDTTMGFTPLAGLVMATRPGDVDPGAVLWALRHGIRLDEAEQDLERHSGLLGLSGRSGDLRQVIEWADAGDAACGAAYEAYVYRLQREIGSMVVALGGLDALVFTGGAGEGSRRLRVDVCAGLEVLGIVLGSSDPVPASAAEAAPRPGDAVVDRVESPPGWSPAVVVVRAREDLVIARSVRRVLGAPPAAGPAGGP
ncbi:MAG: acetate/propionate family kinase [Actinomycetota bacterium]|nr:acetate/propionate family kinase [Actinomycetota bacterium]MDA8315909.1 acetate/propionate family kinase [Actinomycetota bacterium]